MCGGSCFRKLEDRRTVINLGFHQQLQAIPACLLITMSVEVRNDMIRPFSGEGDAVAWLKKIQLVAKLQNITDLASFLPFYLEGEALALYLEMDSTDQLDIEEIEKRLKVAFSNDMFTVYAKLVKFRWSGEKVDVYANDEIRRLAGLAGFEDDGLENVVRLTFINDLPDSISASMQQLPNVKSMPNSKLIERARDFTSKLSSAATAHTHRSNHQNLARSRSDVIGNAQRGLMIINVKQKLLKVEDILEGSATVVEDLIWQDIARRFQELFVIGVVSLGIFQGNVIREPTTTTGGLLRQPSPPRTINGARDEITYHFQ